MTFRALNWTALLLSILCTSAWAQDLPRARPEDVGLSPQRMAYLDEFFQEPIRKGELAGIVILVSRHGKVVHLSALGEADIASHRKMETDALFRFYSMTKPITSAALMMLYEEGRFRMTDPISRYIPEFKELRVLRTPDAAFTDTVPAERQPTVQDAFRHTAGFTHGIAGDAFDAQYVNADYFGLEVTLKDMMDKAAKFPLRHQPGKQFVYSIGPDIQARLVEILSGMPFDEFLEKRMLGPLGMADTGFWVPAEQAKRIATVYWWRDGKLTSLDAAHAPPENHGVISRPALVNSYTKNHKRKGGSYGLIGTAADYWRFAQMILNRGELDGTRLLGPRTVQYMLQDHLGKIKMEETGHGFGLGFAVVENAAQAGIMCSEGTSSWGGAANTRFWIDPKENLIIVAMTQHLNVPKSWELVDQLVPMVHAAILE